MTELWEAWLKSEVHNWTVDQTCDWLIQSVQLPQYVNLFRKHNLNGRVLPRLAVNNFHFVGNVLGIKDPIHKQKISLKAMDAVLFGPPRGALKSCQFECEQKLCNQFSLLFFFRNRNQMERYCSRDLTTDSNNRYLVRISAE